MSVIEKMTIMGIRSFGPDDRNKQLIEFFKPLTLILGPNGSGKTTIIECLRYLTTGDTPPNSEKGGSFVHDPKIAGETEVKGQVKLQIRDVLSRRVIVTRNMVATQKQKKIQLRTLDGTVTRYSENGEKTTLSSKCAEIDKEMITALGVSKPILASVIFCHQEDSNWPLSEGKNVKQKFDEIFAATRYIKALEVIRKTRQEKVVDIRLFKVQVEGLKENRRKATEFGQSLEKTKSRLAACKDAVMEIDNKVKPITDKLQNIAIKEHEIGKLNSDLESNNKVMAKLEKDEKDMKNSIEHLFEGTKEDLKQEMDNFNTVVMSKKKQLDTVKRKCSENENEQRVYQKKLSRMQEDFGKLKAGQKAHQERITARDAKLGNLGEQLGLGGLSLDTDEMMKDSEVQNVLRNWKQKLVKTQQELKFTKTKYEDTENKLQSQIDTVRDKKSQKEQNQKNCTQKIAKNKETLRNIDAELSQVDSLANRQDDLKEDLAEAEKELASLEKAVDVNTLRGKISVNQRRKRELELKLTSLNDEMFQLQKESKVRTEIDLISKDKTSKQEAVDRMLQRHRETVIHLIGNMPERNAQDNIKALVTTLSREIQEKNKELEKNRSRISSLNTSKSFLQQDLKKREELLVSHKNKIFNACGNENFDEGLDVLQKTVKELQDQKGAVEGSLFLYNEYIEKLSSRKPCCPLCERAFQKNEEIENLRRDIQRKLQLVPSQLTKKEKLIGEHQKRLNGMLELRPLKQEIRNIFEKEIPEVKSKILKVDEDLEKIVEEISDLEEILESKQCDSRTATEMLPDLAMLDQSQRELLRLERRLSTLTCQLGSSDVSRTINVVGDEQSTVQKEMDEVKNLIEASQLRISEHGEQVQRLRGQINDLRAEQVEISGRLQKKNALEDQMSVLAAENVEFANLIKEIKVELADFDKKIVELAAEKRQVKNDKEVELEKIRNKINAEQKEMDYIDGLTREIDRYVNGGKEQELTEQESKISSVNSDISAMGNELTRLDKEKDNLNKLITSQQIKFREYEDNLKLMEIHDEIKSLKSKCGKLREKIGDFDIRTFLREKRQLGDQEKQLTKERNEHEGRQSELVKQVSLLDSQLQDKVYRDADKKHKEMIIKLRTTELTCEDMNKYYAALDQAVMNHHRMKMDEINKIIRDLWIKTYSGNDIDYIEIRSNDDDTEADLTKARRIYNYRVVMMKGEIAVDMRGRCSAGQKVLASLIIRLALAETFCLNCGILALDEPTTNLDRDNIGSLAKALVEIVKSRSEQRNFQLIIITHDEDFIELLGRSDTVDYFYKVSKDENTWSRLAKCRVSEMA